MMASRKSRCKEQMFSSSSSSEEEIATGYGDYKGTSKDDPARKRLEKDLLAGIDALRQEKNPFSFKHFLKKGAQPNYSKVGARPKVYFSPAPSPNNLEKDSTVYSRNPTELPDFVQDHLVVEQCYLNHESKQQPIPDVDNLPDFALNSVEQEQARLRSEFKKGECFLYRLPRRSPSVPSTSCSPHLNLTAFDKPNTGSTERPESSGFPLDLPIALSEPDPDSNSTVRNTSGTNETDVPKSLPDFLNDGPIHNRTASPADSESVPNSTEPTKRRLLLENERLRYELELARKQITEKSKRILSLESELASRRELENEETSHLERCMVQVEDNLKHSTAEISLLKSENEELKVRTASRIKGQSGSPSTERIRKLAGDLRTAASSAEMSLRQLMSGVDNLRVLASAFENVDRIEDRTKDFVPHFDEDNAAGPAL
ncbi:lethal (3) 04053 isoform X2 [Calliopsis andreniformis]|uniref:lethal (3) 04053 isoform X2 n=1 Tax=Calliopsis andreniformis TaxID=337506 RepID=UPI003FCCA4E8